MLSRLFVLSGDGERRRKMVLLLPNAGDAEPELGRER